MAAAWVTRSRSSSRTLGSLLITRDTVFMETSASRATSMIVGFASPDFIVPVLPVDKPQDRRAARQPARLHARLHALPPPANNSRHLAKRLPRPDCPCDT